MKMKWILQAKMKKWKGKARQNKKTSQVLRLGGANGGLLRACRIPILFPLIMLQIPCQLEENLQTVDAGDADIADGADFVGAEELDSSRTLIEIVL